MKCQYSMSYIISFIVDILFFLLHIVELGLSGPFVSSFGFVLLLILLVLLLRPIVNTNSPCLTSLNSDIASWCVIPWTALPLIENISSPMHTMNKCIGKCIITHHKLNFNLTNFHSRNLTFYQRSKSLTRRKYSFDIYPHISFRTILSSDDGKT